MSRRSIRWRPGRKAWLQVAKGEVSVGAETLNAGDAAAITDQDADRGALARPRKCCCSIWRLHTRCSIHDLDVCLPTLGRDCQR